MGSKPHTFGYTVFNKDYEIDEILKQIEDCPGTYLFTSPSMWVEHVENSSMEKLLNKAQILFSDGVGTSLATLLQSGLSAPRITGPDITNSGLKRWKSKPMVFIGGDQKTYENIKRKFGLTRSVYIEREHLPASQENTLRDVKKIKELEPDPELIWVCLGSPKQEYWTMNAQDDFPNSRILPVGAAFDFLGGNRKRAPKAIQKIGLEWLYRFYQEPRRLFQRTVVTNLKLVLYSILYRGKVNAPLWKRCLDIALGLPLLVLAAPIMAISAAAIWLEDGYPVFYKQTRIGKDGVPFDFYKLRSMIHGAENYQEKLSDQNEYQNMVPFKIKNDPRITKVGKVIRRWSIDELPQLLNILKGDMSLVGPRPPLPREYAVYNDYEKKRMSVVPGLTGLCQIKARGKRCFRVQVNNDLRYIRKRKLGLDLWIILKTIPIVLSGDGAD